MKLFFLWLLCAGIALAAPARIVRFTATEDGGVARRSVLVEQGVPIAPMARAEVAHLAVLDRSNRAVPAGIEIEGVGPDGRVRWLRISLALDLQPWEKRDFDLVRDSVPSQPPLLKTQTEGERILVESGDYQAIFAGRSNFQLRRGGALLFD